MVRAKTSIVGLALLLACCGGEAASKLPPPMAANYSVSGGQRQALRAQWQLVQSDSSASDSNGRLLALRDALLSPAAADEAAYPAYAQQGSTQGMVRLLPETVGGLGNLYSFAAKSHSSGTPADLLLRDGTLVARGAGVDYGLLTNLGGVSLDSLTTESPGVSFAALYAPHAPCEAPDGVIEHNGYSYAPHLTPVVGDTYVLRAVHYGDGDATQASNVLAAFQVVRQDEADHSLILIWRILQTYPAPPFSDHCSRRS